MEFQNELNALPVLSIRADHMVTYSEYLRTSNKTKEQIENERNLTRGEYNGHLSVKSKRRIKKYLGTWIGSVIELRRQSDRKDLIKLPYLTFVTLTLPARQMHSDIELKRLALNRFLIWLCRTWDCKEYFWRAEPQENGNLHFHIITDSYIPWAEIRKYWNAIMEDLGYIDEFERRANHRNPNSTDIHKLERVNNITAYVIKYCTKSKECRPIEGRLTGCSSGIRSMKAYSAHIGRLEKRILYIAVNELNFEELEGDGFTVLVGDMARLRDRCVFYWKEFVEPDLIRQGMQVYGKRRAIKQLSAPPVARSEFNQGSLFAPSGSFLA